MTAQAIPRPGAVKSHAYVYPALMALAGFALLVVLWLYAPNFFRFSNVINVFVQASILGLLAVGMAAVLITGGIDLSMPSNMALSAVLGAMAMRATGNPLVGPPVMLAVGLALGAVNAFAVSKLKMIPFVVTLSTMTVASGLCVWLTNSTSITGLPKSYAQTLLAKPFGLPVAVIVLIAVTVGVGYSVQRGIAGRYLYSVGLNARAARIARVPVGAVIGGVYLFSGFMAGLTGVMLTARLGSASANMGADSLTLDIIAACVVGGVSTFGGVGRIHGAVLGAVLITILSNALNLAGVSFYLGLVLKGAVIIAFVASERHWRR